MDKLHRSQSLPILPTMEEEISSSSDTLTSTSEVETTSYTEETSLLSQINHEDDPNRLASVIEIIDELYQDQTNDLWKRSIMEKLSHLQEEDLQACIEFINSPTLVISTNNRYLLSLYDTIYKQLLFKLNHEKQSHSNITLTPDQIQRRALRLLKGFLKERLSWSPSLTTEEFLRGINAANRAEMDPHFHLNSIFVRKVTEARCFLPNFEESYNYLWKYFDAMPPDQFDLDFQTTIKATLNDTSSAHLTEAQISAIGIEKWQKMISSEPLDEKKKMVHLKGIARHQPKNCTHGMNHDVCGPERMYHSLKNVLEHENVDPNSPLVLRVHMGETIQPELGRENIDRFLEEVALYYKEGPNKVLRIGHGTHASFDAMKKMAEKNIFVEACMSSNKKTAILEKRSDYPLGPMLLLGVNVVIGTDGGELYGTTLSKEFVHAEKNLEKFCRKIDQGDESPITLPNGDILKIKHLTHLRAFQGRSDLETPVTYKDLQAISEEERASLLGVNRLTENANNLKRACGY